jgi:tRNA-dihydrouridine synthase C
MLNPNKPALVLAPMDGITDAPMRALQGATGAFSYAVSEFLRVSSSALPQKVFRRDVPELMDGCRTPSGMPVQVQILGGDPRLMAISAFNACRAGATAIDINFGCPAPTVNRHDGGASLLQHPDRLRDIVRAVRDAVKPEISVSAKLRLGWDCIEAIEENATMAVEGGASWLTIHARTRTQGYAPPVFWKQVGKVRRQIGIPIIANGDIWSMDDFLRCREETDCDHFMIGRGALADPSLPYQIANELGLRAGPIEPTDWLDLFARLLESTRYYESTVSARPLTRAKQWLAIASKFGEFPYFDLLKHCLSIEDLLGLLAELTNSRQVRVEKAS